MEIDEETTSNTSGSNGGDGVERVEGQSSALGQPDGDARHTAGEGPDDDSFDPFMRTTPESRLGRLLPLKGGAEGLKQKRQVSVRRRRGTTTDLKRVSMNQLPSRHHLAQFQLQIGRRTRLLSLLDPAPGLQQASRRLFQVAGKSVFSPRFCVRYLYNWHLQRMYAWKTRSRVTWSRIGSDRVLAQMSACIY